MLDLLLFTIGNLIYIGQRKAFYKQRIPDSNCVVKETVYIDT